MWTGMTMTTPTTWSLTKKTSRISQNQIEETAKYTVTNSMETRKTSRTSHGGLSLVTEETSHTSFRTI